MDISSINRNKTIPQKRISFGERQSTAVSHEQKQDEFVVQKPPHKSKAPLFAAILGVIGGIGIGIAIALSSSGKSSAKLEKELGLITKENENSKKLISELQESLSHIPEEVISGSKEEAEKHYNQAKTLISKPLSYDPTKPPLEKIEESPYSSKVKIQHESLPPVKNTRAHLPNFVPPKRHDIVQKGQLEVNIPIENAKNIKASIDSDARKITVSPNRLGVFEKMHMKLNYGRTVKWTERKVARDLMQNFYDGHGHTLEGVSIHAQHNPKTNTYKIRVSGKGEFNHEKIQDLGATSKQENPKNAGGFGEGAKIMTTIMLSEFDVKEVKFSSANWLLTYKGENGDLVNRLEVLERPTHGNFIEFETSNEKLVDSILESTNYFYHPQNPDFKNLTFENDHFGFKFHGAQAPSGGNLYVTQRFEYDGSENWDNKAENITLLFKRKPTASGVLYANRDRTQISSREIENLAQHFAETMSDKELANSISSLKDIWGVKSVSKMYPKQSSKEDAACTRFLHGLISNAYIRNIKLEFKPNEKFVALTNKVSPDIVKDLEHQGYTICSARLHDVGVKDIVTVVKEMRNHGALVPTAAETKKIKIIDEAAKIITESMNLHANKKVVSPEDATKPTYIFKRMEDEDTLAEAITKLNTKTYDKDYLGHWVDRDYLSKANFDEMLATRLHETCHKYAGDGDPAFGYKLTNLLEDYSHIISSDVNLRKKLAPLKRLWKEVSTEEKK